MSTRAALKTCLKQEELLTQRKPSEGCGFYSISQEFSMSWIQKVWGFRVEVNFRVLAVLVGGVVLAVLVGGVVLAVFVGGVVLAVFVVGVVLAVLVGWIVLAVLAVVIVLIGLAVFMVVVVFGG